MKLCNTEIMKRIKFLEQQKYDIKSEERRICKVTYISEEDKIDDGYSFSETTETIRNIDNEIRNLRHLLSYSNVTTIIEEFGMSLGECLVYMAQLNNEKGRLETLAQKEPKSRYSTSNGIIEYTELNYDVEKCKKELTTVLETISRLQIIVDRTNLTNMIDVG